MMMVASVKPVTDTASCILGGVPADHTDHTDRRDAILGSALQLILEKGMGSVSARDVARRAGVSAALVHHHFGTMEDMLAAAFSRFTIDVLAQMGAAVNPRHDPLVQLDCYLAFCSPDPDDPDVLVWLEGELQARRSEAFNVAAADLCRRWRSFLADILEQGARLGSWNCPDPGSSARLLMATMDGLALQTAADGDFGRTDVLELGRRAAELELGLPLDSLAALGGTGDNRLRLPEWAAAVS